MKLIRGCIPRTFFLLLITLLSIPTSLAATEKNSLYHTRHVIVAVMDGVRYSETFGDHEHRYVPQMWRELVPQGVLYTNFRNLGVTVTRQGHSSIASGTWQVVANGGPRLTMPTFFDYYREETGVAAEKTWAIFGKGSYSFAPYSSFPAYGKRWAPQSEIGIGEGSSADDRKVLAKICSVMKENHSNLIFANFGYTDHSAHISSFQEYSKAITNVDAVFTELWRTIQSDPEYRDSTTLILTNDHGRHDDDHGGYQSHGDGCEGCRHLFLLVLGPDTKKGVTITEPATSIDINPTVGELLGFQTPLAQGRVLQECFTGFNEQNKKIPLTSVEKEAIRIANLSQRALSRLVWQNLWSKMKSAMMPPTPESLIVIQGIYNQVSKANSGLSPEQNLLAFRTVRDWLDQSVLQEDRAAVYKGLIALQINIPGINELPYNQQAQSAMINRLQKAIRENIAQSSNSDFTSVDRAFLINLLSRLATTLPGNAKPFSLQIKSAIDDPLVIIEKLLAPFAGPPSIKNAAPHQEGLILYALSEALNNLEFIRPIAAKRDLTIEAGETLNKTKSKLRQICLLRYYRVVQEQTELGGLWKDPVDSFLYLVAAQRLDTAGLFKGFHSQKQLTAAKKQDEKAAVPEIVLSLSAEAILDWTLQTKLSSKPDRNENTLRRNMSTQIWDCNQYLNFCREQARYLVNEQGGLAGDQPEMAAGAFLILESNSGI